jgi:hypothetical protein
VFRKFIVTFYRSLLILALSCVPLAGQDLPGGKTQSVSLAPVEVTTVTRGKPGTVQLQFRVQPGYHINSNLPRAEFLIPTTLKLTAPTDIVIGKVVYPPGEDMSFAFAPDEKLSVYTGDFGLRVIVRPLVSVVAGKYAIRGQLKYQACDNAACYPPKQLPVSFEIQVAKNAVPARRNPAQSPHVHR